MGKLSALTGLTERYVGTFLEANVKLLMSPEPWARGECEGTFLEQKKPKSTGREAGLQGI